MNISLVLQMAADTFPDRVALTHKGVHFTYGQIHAAAMAAAARIVDSGTDYVSYLGESSPASVIALFGAAMAGRPFAPLNYRLTAPETNRLIERLAPVYLIADATKPRCAGGRASGSSRFQPASARSSRPLYSPTPAACRRR